MIGHRGGDTARERAAVSGSEEEQMSSYNVYRVGGVALSVLLAAGYAGAQQAPSAQKIGVVDMNRLLSETAVAKQQVDRLNSASFGAR